MSEKDYEHAKNVFKTLDCRNMGHYCDLYCRTDVLLLADIFENFRRVAKKIYDLDPARYLTIPSLSWDALLSKTVVELEKITDYDQYLFIESGLRGGISMVSKRFARANNPKVPGYNPSEPKTWLMYLDANNLYGCGMSQSLPTGGLEWLKKEELETTDFLNIPDHGDTGYILEVDLEYPSELHQAHNSYPLAPESLSIEKEWLSPYQLELLGDKPLDKIKKLIPNLRDKEKYVIHYRNLKLYISLGMRLKKVHRGLKFKQTKWMEPYISMNTEYRKQTNSAFEKELYKLMNNSVYG